MVEEDVFEEDRALLVELQESSEKFGGFNVLWGLLGWGARNGISKFNGDTEFSRFNVFDFGLEEVSLEGFQVEWFEIELRVETFDHFRVGYLCATLFETI